MRSLILSICLATSNFLLSQKGCIQGKIQLESNLNEPIYIGLSNLNKTIITDTLGYFEICDLEKGIYPLRISAYGFYSKKMTISITSDTIVFVETNLLPQTKTMEEVVITGSFREITKTESLIPIEILSAKALQKNPTASIFEALTVMNGVKPQLNCNVCNTGDIHINGMEGPYTLIVIDGMPIVSGLSSVYGLSGIPTSLIDRIEVIKGPASSLYGSDAMGGVINVITKSPSNTPLVGIDVFGTSWGEINTDISLKFKLTPKISTLFGINYFNFQNIVDKNNDGFTDLTLQNRLSIFNKWNFNRKDNKVFGIGMRYVGEDRWGGQTNWNKTWRGSDSIYGESIYTNRFELIGNYQLPVKEYIMTQFSYNQHNQNSYYGDTPYMANQNVFFSQMYWTKKWHSKHNVLTGITFKKISYDDNSPATASEDGITNQKDITNTPGFFIQDEYQISTKNSLLVGYRYDYSFVHGNINSPRLAYKLKIDESNIIRLNLGTGFRVVNLFTEDHSALSGARKLRIDETLNPEKSINSNLHFSRKKQVKNTLLENEFTAFYTRFSNKIIGDYETNPQEIHYSNLNGYAISKGISWNLNWILPFGISLQNGITFMDVFSINSSEKEIQFHAPKWSGTSTLTFSLSSSWSIDLTNQWNGSMRLPILPNDYRNEFSSPFTILNIQTTKKFKKGHSIYFGLKNILNFIPKNPIMRPFDPFNKYVNDPINNPNNFTFDPSYNYASLQGIRGFFGFRYAFNK